MPEPFRQEWRLVVEQRGDALEALDRKPYRTAYYAKKDSEKALAGLKDWEENKQKILDSGAGYIVNWSAHVEGRVVTETPWERLDE